MLENFCGYVVTNKKKTTAFVTFFNGFAIKKMAMVITFAFFGRFAAKKVMATMLSPFSMVVVL